MRRLPAGAASAAGLVSVWRAFERNAREVLELAGSPFATLIEVTAADRREAAALTAAGAARLARGDAAGATLEFVRAAACDPWSEPAREGVMVAAAAADDSFPGQRPLAEAAPFVVCADAAELLAQPALLSAYADAMAGLPGVTLAVDASDLAPDAAAAALGALVSDAGLGDDSVDVLAVLGPLDEVGRARFAAGTHARYGAGEGFTPATLDRLRVLAQKQNSCAASVHA
jgi:hypothetical protein